MIGFTGIGIALMSRKSHLDQRRPGPLVLFTDLDGTLVGDDKAQAEFFDHWRLDIVAFTTVSVPDTLLLFL